MKRLLGGASWKEIVYIWIHVTIATQETTASCSNTTTQTLVRQTQLSAYLTQAEYAQWDLEAFLDTCGLSLEGTMSFAACQQRCLTSEDCLALYLSTSLECHLCRQGVDGGFQPSEHDRVFVMLENARPPTCRLCVLFLLYLLQKPKLIAARII